MQKYIFLTNTYGDEDKIFCLKKDAQEICKNCESWEWCKGANIKDGCGCLTAFIEISNKQKPIFYGSNLFPKEGV